MATPGFTLHPMDEDLSLHLSAQRSLTGDPQAPGTPANQRLLPCANAQQFEGNFTPALWDGGDADTRLPRVSPGAIITFSLREKGRLRVRG
jgi:hypothetical protein